MVVSKLFVGSEQTPPLYSAVKVNGVRAYKLARDKKIKLKKKKLIFINL